MYNYWKLDRYLHCESSKRSYAEWNFACWPNLHTLHLPQIRRNKWLNAVHLSYVTFHRNSNRLFMHTAWISKKTHSVHKMSPFEDEMTLFNFDPYWFSLIFQALRREQKQLVLLKTPLCFFTHKHTHRAKENAAENR